MEHPEQQKEHVQTDDLTPDTPPPQGTNGNGAATQEANGTTEAAEEAESA